MMVNIKELGQDVNCLQMLPLLCECQIEVIKSRKKTKKEKQKYWRHFFWKLINQSEVK